MNEAHGRTKVRAEGAPDPESNSFLFDSWNKISRAWRSNKLLAMLAVFIFIVLPIFAVFSDVRSNFFDDTDEKVEEVRGTLDSFRQGGTMLVQVTPDVLERIRNIGKPELRILRYEGDSLVQLDPGAVSLREGEFIQIQFARSDGSVAADLESLESTYLLAVEGDGTVQFYSADDVLKISGGGWQVGRDIDCETLLVLQSDQPLTEEERSSFREHVAQFSERPSLRSNMTYVWRNGEMFGVERTATRDLRRNPDAPLGWAEALNQSLVAAGFAFHGYTYPVDEPDDAATVEGN